jgi:hypothetical protein
MFNIQKFYFFVMDLRMSLKGLMAAFLNFTQGGTELPLKMEASSGLIRQQKQMGIRNTGWDPDPDIRLVSFGAVPDPAN